MGQNTISARASGTVARKVVSKSQETKQPTPANKSSSPANGSSGAGDQVTLSSESKSKEQKPSNMPNLMAAFGGNESGNSSSTVPPKENPPRIVVAEKKEPTEHLEASPAQISAKADGLVEKNTNMLGMNLDEEGLGKDLGQSKDPKVVRETLKRLSAGNQQEVSYEAVKSLSDQEITEMSKSPEGRETLSRLGGRLGEGERGKMLDSKAQLDRVEKLTGERPRPFDNTKSVKFEGEIPEALNGAADDKGGVDLSRVTPEMMEKLSPDQRKAVVKQVEGQQVSFPPTITGDVGKGDGIDMPPPQAAEQYLLSSLSSQKDSSRAVTQTFANLSPQGQSSVKLEPAAAKQIVDQMPLLTRELYDRAARAERWAVRSRTPSPTWSSSTR